jgi:hypothetical protein
MSKPILPLISINGRWVHRMVRPTILSNFKNPGIAIFPFYGGEASTHTMRKWCAWRDLNPQPSDP